MKHLENKNMKKWDEATQLQCENCKSSDFRVVEKTTWWSKENPSLKHYPKHVLIACVKCGTSKKIFFPNLGQKLISIR